MNRPDFCAELLSQIGGDPDLRPYLDEVFVADQGTRKVSESASFAKAEASLDGLLRVVDQANLGGSGGYARGQLEALNRGSADYFMCMDDDVVCEPEGIIRAVTFGDLARRPTIVGGHMFSLYAKTRLHSFGEVVEPWRFWWQSAKNVVGDWDFGARTLRSTPWLHARVDVDFNPWFMALIPLSTLRAVGLSLPLFIKWDDLEFGLRAQEAGIPTVTLPGAAVWHIPWTDKNDGLDWQSYFHQRNRFVSALLHGRHRRGGILVAESFAHQMAHLVAMQYSTVALQQRALDDVFRGPEYLHEELGSKLGEVRELTSGYLDAQLQPDADAFPPVRTAQRLATGRRPPPGPGPGGDAGRRGGRPGASLSPPTGGFPAASRGGDPRRARGTGSASPATTRPSSRCPTEQRRRSTVATTGTYRRLLRRTMDIHLRLYREWPRLARRYRSHLGELSSPETWGKTFDLGGERD